MDNALKNRIVAQLELLVQEQTENLVLTPAVDIAEYRHRIGIIQGLRESIQVLNSMFREQFGQ